MKDIIDSKLTELAKKKSAKDFFQAVRKLKRGNTAIIAEIKLVSPSEGRLGKENEAVKFAQEYEKGGADAISVVADNKYFGGSYKLLKRIKKNTSLPILAKDFVIDSYQIFEAKFFGADAILLIAKLLSGRKLKEYARICFELNIEPVVEVHTKEELRKAYRSGSRIIAVNARDLHSFEVDVGRACDLLLQVSKKYVKLGFSGVAGRREVEKYKRAGIKAVLVGTALMQTKDKKDFIKNLKRV